MYHSLGRVCVWTPYFQRPLLGWRSPAGTRPAHVVAGLTVPCVKAELTVEPTVGLTSGMSKRTIERSPRFTLSSSGQPRTWDVRMLATVSPEKRTREQMGLKLACCRYIDAPVADLAPSKVPMRFQAPSKECTASPRDAPRSEPGSVGTVPRVVRKGWPR